MYHSGVYSERLVYENFNYRRENELMNLLYDILVYLNKKIYMHTLYRRQVSEKKIIDTGYNTSVRRLHCIKKNMLA